MTSLKICHKTTYVCFQKAQQNKLKQFPMSDVHKQHSKDFFINPLKECIADYLKNNNNLKQFFHKNNLQQFFHKNNLQQFFDKNNLQHFLKNPP